MPLRTASDAASSRLSIKPERSIHPRIFPVWGEIRGILPVCQFLGKIFPLPDVGVNLSMNVFKFIQIYDWMPTSIIDGNPFDLAKRFWFEKSDNRGAIA